MVTSLIAAAGDNLIRNPLDKAGAGDNLIENPLDHADADEGGEHSRQKRDPADNLIDNPLDHRKPATHISEPRTGR